MILKLRFWAIRWLAGRRIVILNARIRGPLVLDDALTALVCDNVIEIGGNGGTDNLPLV